VVVNYNLEINPTNGITNESAVVARMVVIPRAWCAIIRSTGFQRRFVELLDLFDRFLMHGLVSPASQKRTIEETARDQDWDPLSAVNAVCCLLEISFAVASSIAQPWTQK